MRARTVLGLLLVLAAWEVAGELRLVADGALPAPSAILLRFWADRADYPPHVWATVATAFLGFVIGNLAAIAAGTAFALQPWTARLARGVNLALFALPPIAIVPVLVLSLDGLWPRVALAALGCWFPTMTATVLGLTQIDARAADLVRAYGGRGPALLRFVRIPASLPAILGGLRVAAPNAVLGAILAEFGSGARWGLGSYLLGSLGRAEPARLWGIGLVATAVAGVAYLAFALAARRATGAARAVTIPASATPPVEDPAALRRPAVRTVIAGAALILPFLLWWALVRGFGLPELIAKTPWGVLDYLLFAPSAPSAQVRLLSALAETLPITLLGMAAGIAVAFALALAADAAPGVARFLLPVALVTQTMPLVALTPLLVLLLGRGTALTVTITVSVTFFPAFVTIAQGLALVPAAARDLPRAYGASWRKAILLVVAPAALPHLFAAARLAVPRALLGVMIAEWLATGRGLGNLLNQSRGFLDYGMIWAVAAVSVAISAVFYQLVVLAERRVLGRMRA